MDIAGFIIAVISFLGGIIGFAVFDHKLKKQQIQINEQQLQLNEQLKIINDKQIKEIAKSEAEELKAEMDCNIIKGNKGSREVRFFNKGKAVARNVRVVFLQEDSSVILHNEWKPYEMITPQDFRSEIVSLCNGHEDVLKLKILWNDDYGTDREIVVSRQL